ncbi:NUDIX domain-containing protein [Actibacterium lipolyticum]|nr:gamma-glutamylcyclotransferase [Actibacterium lipolyticum]
MFFYGTLCHRPLLECVLGDEREGVQISAARLPGYASYWVKSQSYPMIEPLAGGHAEGLLVRGLSERAIARLNFYEGGFSYCIEEVTVEYSGEFARADVYFPQAEQSKGEPWCLEDWAKIWGPVTVIAAQEVMQDFGIRSAAEIAQRFGSIRSRAASRIRAQDAAPTTLRGAAVPSDVRLHKASRPYADFFSVEEYELTHRRFAGGESAVLSRAGFVATDAATLLPYDPVRDRVLLIEQFRVGPFARGDAQCWSLEAIAGRIDPGETPEEAARREAQEEAHLTIGALHPVFNYYPSPGALSEFLYSYVAIADLPDDAAGLGGAVDEGEDIRAHVIGFERLMALLDTGEVQNAPLIISALWLARNRDRLRAGA